MLDRTRIILQFHLKHTRLETATLKKGDAMHRVNFTASLRGLHQSHRILKNSLGAMRKPIDVV
jgi:hypothetical protein